MAVLIAFVANLLVAIAKSVAAAVTGSASLLAEAVHSWADAGNEIFLLIAERKSGRPRDHSHPLGYGRDAYVWSLFAAFGVFTIGAVLSIITGVQGLLEPEPAGDYLIGYLVLAVAFVLEGFSLVQSVRQARRDSARYRRGFFDFVLNGSNPTLRAVVAEDTAALLGLLVAAAGLVLHEITGDSVWDAIGSIVIGLLLASVALLLIDRNRDYLVGATPPAAVRQGALDALRGHPEIERVTALHLEFVGPGTLSLVAAVDLTGDAREAEVARRLRRLERAIEEKVEPVVSAVLTLSVSDEPPIVE
jgi:cation diffusion facilitator family transporter